MRGRGRFGPLTERPFRLLWLGRTGSSIGDALIGAVPVLALVPPLPLAVIVAASAAFGIAIVFGNTLWETALQQEVRPDRLARVGSIDWLLSLCLMPAGQALAGPLVGPLGVRGTLILAAALMSVPNVCVLAFVREVRRVRRRDAPDPAPA